MNRQELQALAKAHRSSVKEIKLNSKTSVLLAWCESKGLLTEEDTGFEAPALDAYDQLCLMSIHELRAWIKAQGSEFKSRSKWQLLCHASTLIEVEDDPTHPEMDEVVSNLEEDAAFKAELDELFCYSTLDLTQDELPRRYKARPLITRCPLFKNTDDFYILCITTYMGQKIQPKKPMTSKAKKEIDRMLDRLPLAVL